MARTYDGLYNELHVPLDAKLRIEESRTLLSMPLSLQHELPADQDQRAAQLTYVVAQQLQRKPTIYASGLVVERVEFDPAMDVGSFAN